MRCEAPDEFHDQVRFLGAADCVDSGELFRGKVSAYNLVLLLFMCGSGKAKEGVLAPKSLHKFLEGPPTATPDRELIEKLQQGWGLRVRTPLQVPARPSPVCLAVTTMTFPFENAEQSNDVI